MNSGGCVTEMTDGFGGADEGEIGLFISYVIATPRNRYKMEQRQL